MDAPFAITMSATGDDALAPLLRWIGRALPDVAWLVAMIEATYAQPDPGLHVTSAELQHLFASQVIELQLDGSVAGNPRWRVIVRDGSSVDLLGFGAPPTAFELGGTYRLAEPADFRWPR